MINNKRNSVEDLELLHPNSLSEVKVSYYKGCSRVNAFYEILALKYVGTFGIGSKGNADAQYMYATGEFGLHCYSPLGIVLDFSELEYEWGDMIEMVFDIGSNHFVGKEYPLALVVSDRCKEAIGTLFFGLESDKAATEKEWIFDDFGEAWTYVEEQIEKLDVMVY